MGNGIRSTHVLALAIAGLLGCKAGPPLVLATTASASVIQPAGTSVISTVATKAALPWIGSVDFTTSGCGTLSAKTGTTGGAVAGVPTPATVTLTGAATEQDCVATIVASVGSKYWFGDDATSSVSVTVQPLAASTSTVAGWTSSVAAPTITVTPSVNPPTWTYFVDVTTAAGATDTLFLINVSLDAPCTTLTSKAGSVNGSGPTATWLVTYGTGVTSDTLSFACKDANVGGKAAFDVRVDALSYIASKLTVAGPKP
jgi:hypothetical protein